MDAYDTYLVMSFVGETRVLGMNQDDELDEAEIAGFDSAASVSLVLSLLLLLSLTLFLACERGFFHSLL